MFWAPSSSTQSWPCSEHHLNNQSATIAAGSFKDNQNSFCIMLSQRAVTHSHGSSLLPFLGCHWSSNWIFFSHAAMPIFSKTRILQATQVDTSPSLSTSPLRLPTFEHQALHRVHAIGLVKTRCQGHGEKTRVELDNWRSQCARNDLS